MTATQVLSLIVARWPVLVLCSALAVILGTFWASDISEKYLVRAEILVVPSYEYTAPSVRRSNPTQITRMDLDVLVNNEVQILTGAAAITQAARNTSPTESLRDTLTAAQLLELVAIRRVENTSVIDLQIIDENTEWAIEFANALIEAYKVERSRLFSDPSVERGLSELIATVTSDIDLSSERLSQLESELYSFAAKLQNSVASSPGFGLALASTAKDQLQFASIALRLEEKLSLPPGWQIGELTTPLLRSTAETSADGSGTETSGLEQDLPSISELLNDHDADQEFLDSRVERLRELEELQMQNSLRLASNTGIHVLTPPFVSDAPVGLPDMQGYIVLAIIGAFIGVLGLVSLEEMRIRKRQRNSAS